MSTLTTHIQNPPGRWVRLSRAAHRLGMSRHMVLTGLETGTIPCRVAYLGRKGMPHLSENDLAEAEQLLATGHAPGRQQ